MCGRFFIAPENEELLFRMLEEASRRQTAILGESTVATGEVFPAAMTAALAAGRSGNIGAFPMEWGFHRADSKGLIINVRSETAMDKPAFRTSMLERRCVIPCSWYFEWERTTDSENTPEQISSMYIPEGRKPEKKKAGGTRKTKYAIRPKGTGLMYLAAIYRYEENRKLPVYAVLTREAASGISFIHPRMPVIFTEKNYMAWLDKTQDPEAALRFCEKDMQYRKE